jgi:Flp pilus assembly protein CpaB
VRNWRVLTAIAAVVLAALAGVLVWKYTDNAKKDAERPFDRIEVLVASKPIATGTGFATALEQKLITREKRVRSDLPDEKERIAGAASDADLKTAFKNLVAGHNITANETIVRSDFLASGQIVSGLSGALANEKGKEAITVTFDDEHAVGGFLKPGDLVNIIVSGDVKDLTVKDSKTVKATSYMLSGMKVLAVGPTTAVPQAAPAQAAQTGGTTTPTTVASTQSRGNITFEVTPRQAEQLAQAKALGLLIYLTLNPTGFKAGDFKRPVEIVEAVNLFDVPQANVDRILKQLNSAP